MSASPRLDSRQPQRVTILMEDQCWRRLPRIGSRLRRAAEIALQKSHRRKLDLQGGITVLLTSDERVRALNAQFRGKDKPTNVLSFPAKDTCYLGDLAIAYGVASQEAESEGKVLADHVTHLAVHGVLHLLGYDHENAGEAEIMESLEIEVLGEFGIPNPYERRDAA